MLLTQEEVKRLFDYNPDTGVVSRRVRTANRTKVGDVVGCREPRGYLKLKIYNKTYLLHRVIWLLMTGAFPEGQVDHINQVREDNRWCNLRDVSPQDNLRNTSLSKNNLSGFNGVCFYKQTNRWKAYIKVSGEVIHLGYFLTLDEAILARQNANLLYEFHPNHGRLECITG